MIYAPGVKTAKAQSEAAPALKIMPLGDSITASFSPYSSYRCYLYHSLVAANYRFLYAGSRTTGSYNETLPPCGNPPAVFDPHNEGYSGAMAWDFLYNKTWPNTIDNILNRTVTFYDGSSGPNIPDIVLMHLGTNDLGQVHPISQIISDLGTIIDHIRAKNPRVAILIAQIIPCAPYNWCNNVPVLNAAIPGLALQKHTLSSPVIAVDMYTGYDPLVDNALHNNDYVHPNSTGDAIMAARWMAAIQALLNRTTSQVYIPMAIK